MPMKILRNKPGYINTVNTVSETSRSGDVITQRKVINSILGRSGNGKGSQHAGSLPGDLKTGAENISGIDMTDVRVHYNSEIPSHIDALAYTAGEDIYLGPDQEKHLPHETWHVVQQKQRRVDGGVQAMGRRINTDIGLETEADRIGGILRDNGRKRENGELTKLKSNDRTQRKAVSTHYGSFDFKIYDFHDDAKNQSKSLGTEIHFMPNSNVTTTKVGLLQATRLTYGKKHILHDPNSASKMSTTTKSKGTSKSKDVGWAIDRGFDYVNPLFATEKKPAVGKKGTRLEHFDTYSDEKLINVGEHGVKKGKTWTPAKLMDAPTVHDDEVIANKANKKNKITPSTLEIETVAMGLSVGNIPKSRYYSSVKWGWTIDAAGKLTKITPSKVDPKTKKSGISEGFQGAINAWNKGRTKGKWITKGKTYVYQNFEGQSATYIKGSQEVTPVYTKGVKYKGKNVGDPDTKFVKGVGYIKVQYLETSFNGILKKNVTGYVKVSDIKDDGSGDKVLKLPVP